MWTSLCNFLCNKLFHLRKIGFQRRSDSDEHIYGKRMKVADRFWNKNDVVNQNRASLSMQKENIEISDDEEECCIIAEIPRRKKAWSLKEPEKKTDLASQCAEGVRDQRRLTSVTLRKSPLDELINDKEVKFLTRNLDSDEGNKVQVRKFFSSPRIWHNHGKVGKSRLSYRNQLKRKINFLQESYRLTEKLQYMQLLQFHTTFNLVTLRPPLRSSKCLPEAVEVVDLTDEKPDHVNKNSNLVTETKQEDEDVKIVKEIHGVRSLQDLLKIKPVDVDVAVNKLLPDNSKDDSDVNASSLQENRISLTNSDYTNQKAEALEEKLRSFVIITTPDDQEVEIIDKQCTLPELSFEQQKRIKNALIPEPSREVLSEGFGLQITRQDMQTLYGLNWLNDEIINFYCNLIMARSEANTTLPKAYAFNTFFYSNLVTKGYSSVRRWTKQVDIFSFDMILVPIHLGMHWCLSVIDFRNKSVRYYDSVGSPNDWCLERLLLYLEAEYLDKKGKIFSTGDWEAANAKDIPQQMNGADCGVFSCMFAEFLSRDCSISFTQDDMPYFRKKIVIEILDKKLLT